MIINVPRNAAYFDRCNCYRRLAWGLRWCECCVGFNLHKDFKRQTSNRVLEIHKFDPGEMKMFHNTAVLPISTQRQEYLISFVKRCSKYATEVSDTLLLKAVILRHVLSTMLLCSLRVVRV